MVLRFIYKNMAWLLPLIAMLLITPLTPSLDLAISHYFYDGTQSFTSNPLYTFMYKYGFVPADALSALALVFFMLSFVIPYLKKWRAPFLVLFLTMAVGAGLIVHGILKDHWGRPRPKQVIEFGGSQAFRPYYQPNFFHQPEPSKSFSCGHCTAGFYFFAVALVGRRLNSKPLFWIGIVLALSLGILLSLTRMAQGGHFFTDTLASALVMWLTAYFCDKIVYFYAQRQNA